MFKLRQLPFSREEISDFLSDKTFEYHYGKHHQTYVNNLNNLVKGTKFENSDLLEIVLNADGVIFNNSAQVFNHDFFWDCITPKPKNMSDEFKSAIESSFGSVEKFKEEFISKATTIFGSGWCWLVFNNNKLHIVQTGNAQVPMTEGNIPLLVVDVWEHAYYIDYKNGRPNYLEKFWNFINWDFVSKMYALAKSKGMESMKEYMKSVYPA